MKKAELYEKIEYLLNKCKEFELTHKKHRKEGKFDEAQYYEGYAEGINYAVEEFAKLLDEKKSLIFKLNLLKEDKKMREELIGRYEADSHLQYNQFKELVRIQYKEIDRIDSLISEYTRKLDIIIKRG